MWDKTFRLPVPPVDAVSNVLVDHWATVIYTTISVLTLLYGLFYWSKTGKPTVVLMMVGGALCATVEPFVNIVGAVWHPVVNQVTAFELMGRPMPWFLVTGYVFYFGALGFGTYVALERGISTRQFWLLATVPMVIDIVMEELMLYWDLYIYYGEQPLKLIKLPLWWVPCNSLGLLLGVCLIVKAAPMLKGWRQWVFVPILMPVADAVAYATISLPSWFVVNTPVPYWVNQLGGLATCGLALLLIHGLAQVVPNDSPLTRALARSQPPGNATGKKGV